ncbi:MAG: hypothetical protein NTV34_03125 [Proteobacteria bacterium]|nr:hypothetical protein [Pseudomonadota bacterium]
MMLNGGVVTQVLLCAGVLFFSNCKTDDSGGSGNSSEKAVTGGAGQSIKDGCYALSVPGSSSGVICVGGLSDEGIGGSGVRVAYGTQTSSTEWCGKSTSAGFKEQQFVVSFNPATQMISMSFKGTPDRGTVIIKETDPRGGGTMSYNYMAYLKANDMLSSKVCKDAGVSSGGGTSGGSSSVGTNGGSSGDEPSGGLSTCKNYIGSCPGGRKPVTCPDSFYCIEEGFGDEYPHCVPKNKLVDGHRTCSAAAPCKKCP